MTNLVDMTITHGLNKLDKDICSFVFREVFLLLDPIEQFSSLAELLDQENVIIDVKDLVELDYIRVIEGLEVLDLALELRFINDISLRDLLNCSHLLRVSVHCFEHEAKRAFSHCFVHVKIVVLEDIMSLLQHEMILLDHEGSENTFDVDFLSVRFEFFICEGGPLTHRGYIGVSNDIGV